MNLELSDFNQILYILVYVISSSQLLLDILSKIKKFREKKRIKQKFWSLIEGYVIKYEKAYNKLTRILGKMLGYAFLLSTEDYKKELKELTKEFDQNFEVLLNSLYRIIENIVTHKDDLKDVIDKEDWIVINHIINAYTNGKVNWNKLIDPGSIKFLLGKDYSSFPFYSVNENLLILSSEINKLFDKYELEAFAKVEKELSKYIFAVGMCISSKVSECIVSVMDTKMPNNA